MAARANCVLGYHRYIPYVLLPLSRSSSCDQEQVTQRSIGRSRTATHQWGLSYIYERAARPLLAAVWLIKRWQYGTYGCNPSSLCQLQLQLPLELLHSFYLFHCDLSLFYKACGLHSKALPLLHAAWLAPLQGLLRWVLFCSWVCVIFQLIKLIKWANWRFGDLNYVTHCGDLCARRVHKLGDLISKLSWLHFFESRFPWDRLIHVVNAFDLNYQGAISSRFHCAPIVVGAHPRRRQINSRSELPFNLSMSSKLSGPWERLL